MNSTIRALSLASMLVGASFLAPHSLSAQGKGRGAAKQEQKAEQQATKQEQKADQQAMKQEQKADEKIKKQDDKVEDQVEKTTRKETASARKETERTTRAARKASHRTTRLTRTTATRYSRTYNVLCEDGTWARNSASCTTHGGVASRQYTPTPRASEQGIIHANEHSAVARAYANSTARGALARCSDGTYWHSTTRTDACTNHGGVARWLRK